jgi:hypothetical protein
MKKSATRKRKPATEANGVDGKAAPPDVKALTDGGAVRDRLSALQEKLAKKFEKPVPNAHLARLLGISNLTLTALQEGKGAPRAATVAKVESLEQKEAAGGKLDPPPSRGRKARGRREPIARTAAPRRGRPPKSAAKGKWTSQELIAALIDFAETARDPKPFYAAVKALVTD